jgi:hypothetical protein
MNSSRNLMVYGVIAGVITLGSTFFMNSMAAPQAEVNEMAKRLEELPKRFGDWEMASAEQLLELHERELQCHGYVMRTYVRSKTGDRVNVAVLLGPHGPIAQHEPQTCYPMSGYEEVQRPTKEELPSGPESKIPLSTAVYRSPADGSTIKIAWGWNDGSGWESPDTNPRFRYAGKPFLYKLQAVYKMNSLREGSDQGLRSFMEEFIPILNQQIGHTT